MELTGFAFLPQVDQSSSLELISTWSACVTLNQRARLFLPLNSIWAVFHTTLHIQTSDWHLALQACPSQLSCRAPSLIGLDRETNDYWRQANRVTCWRGFSLSTMLRWLDAGCSFTAVSCKHVDNLAGLWSDDWILAHFIHGAQLCPASVSHLFVLRLNSLFSTRRTLLSYVKKKFRHLIHGCNYQQQGWLQM